MNKKLFQVLIGGAALVLALSGCGGGGGSGGSNDNGGGGGGGGAAQYDGAWKGTTSQEKSIGFTVENNAVTSVTVGFKTQGTYCSSDNSTTVTKSFPINGNQFSVTAEGSLAYTITGTFNSNTAASGNIQFTDSYCLGSGEATWQAAKVNNTAPVANAGPDQSVKTGTVVTLDGSGSSDANGDTLAYRWSLESKPSGSNAFLADFTAKPTFTVDVAGTYVARLVVHDGIVDSAPDDVTITATTAAANAAPAANAGPDQNVSTGAVVTLDGSGSSDADGNPLTYQWSFVSKPAGNAAVLADPTTAKPSFTADMDGTYVVDLVVNDGIVNSAADNVTITASKAANYDGTWSGNTSQGEAITFSVVNNAIVSTELGFQIYTCGVSGTSKSTFSGPISISGDHFSISIASSPSISLSGTFSSSTNVSGNVRFNYSPPYIPGLPYCVGSANATWTATKQ